ncbi:prepilin-type N-terminal cleavage/methylation domain-containing protein [Patescibacteria group bacterium]|nr:prepilin-type N-terminal cleavage/methylation domain-containing protein [Patescibacteria group bacterium]
MKQFSNKKGFTLVEIVVVFFIIILLSAIILTNYQAGGQQFALQRSANKLSQDIRRAQEMAMSVKEVGPSGAKIVPEGGYGIYFKTSPQKIIIFNDCNNNQQYTPGNVCGTPPDKFPEKIEDINLESGVRIENLSPSTPLHITFKPPDPTISISDGDQAIITLTLEADPSKTKTIKVNKVGLVEIE